MIDNKLVLALVTSMSLVNGEIVPPPSKTINQEKLTSFINAEQQKLSSYRAHEQEMISSWKAREQQYLSSIKANMRSSKTEKLEFQSRQTEEPLFPRSGSFSLDLDKQQLIDMYFQEFIKKSRFYRDNAASIFANMPAKTSSRMPVSKSSKRDDKSMTQPFESKSRRGDSSKTGIPPMTQGGDNVPSGQVFKRQGSDQAESQPEIYSKTVAGDLFYEVPRNEVPLAIQQKLDEIMKTLESGSQSEGDTRIRTRITADQRALVFVFGTRAQKQQILKTEFIPITGYNPVTFEVKNRTMSDHSDGEHGFENIRGNYTQFSGDNNREIEKIISQKLMQLSMTKIPSDESDKQRELKSLVEKAEKLFYPHNLKARMHITQRKVLVNAHSENGTSGFVFNLNGVPFIRAAHFDQTSDGFHRDSFRVSFLRVVEVVNGTKVEDSKNVIDLTGGYRRWSPIEFTELKNDDVTIQNFRSTLDSNGTNITISAMISNKVLLSTEYNQTSVLTPFRLKYNVEINNFPFTSDDSELVIVKSVETINALDHESGSIVTNGGKFMWSGTVLVDSEAKNISSIPLKQSANLRMEDEDLAEDFDKDMGGAPQLMAFDLGHGMNVVWDPSLNLKDDIFGPTNIQVDVNAEYDNAAQLQNLVDVVPMEQSVVNNPSSVTRPSSTLNDKDEGPITSYRGDETLYIYGITSISNGTKVIASQNNGSPNLFKIVGLVGASLLATY
eukprot:NODE_14_length_42432_cov_0.433799.p3 type:complete len:725 gc:universal NODE_14_length_42432_cov_0.433799:30624-28450(-)